MNLYPILSANAGVAALVGDGASPETFRIYPAKLPQKPTLPAITFSIVSGAPGGVTHTGPDGLSEQRVQVDCWATTYSGADALFQAVRKAINGFKDNTTRGIFLVNQRDMYDNEALLYRRSADFHTWSEESV